MISGFLKTVTNGVDGVKKCLLITLMVLSLLSQGQAQAQKTCTLLEEAETKAKELHNKYREDLAKKALPVKTYGNIQGSTSLFKLTYDCEHESLASAVINNKDCSRTSLNLTLAGKGTNIFRNYVENDPTGNGATLATYFEYAIKKWAEISSPLNSDVIYRDDSMISFANMINYKALRFGCVARWCDKELVIACVYSDVPKQGDVLYLANSKKTDGCTQKSTCQKVVKSDGNCDPGTGLCTTTAESIDTTTAATTTTTTSSTTSATISSSQSSTASTTTASATVENEMMTDTIRTRVVTMHNWRRSNLAKGNERNGKVGKANFKTAMNIYEMRYDHGLETEAQNYANLCQSGGSTVSSRQQSGENTYFTTSTTMQPLDVVVEGIKSWWKKIRSVGINYQMLYTQQLENKPNAPVGFTQMAWAASYKVGCGMKRCSFGTVLVCRYGPRGNIYNQYIYQVGTLCGSCSSTCKDGLCPAPAS